MAPLYESDYDALGRLRWLGYALEGASTAESLWEVLALTPAGGSLLERSGNGLVTGIGRDVVDQMTSLSIRKVSGVGSAWDRDAHAVEPVVRDDLEDGFAGAGPSDTRYGLSTIVRNGFGAVRWVEGEGAGLRSSVFEYDQGGRLTTAAVAGYGFEYGYDRLQNLTKRVTAVVPGGAMAPELQSGTYSFFSGTRRVSGISEGLTSTSFAYDAGGRTTSWGSPAFVDTSRSF